MKKVYVLILCVLFIKTINAQYPLFEDFNNINGVGLWNNLTGQADVCCHNGLELCFNCTSTYNRDDIYIVQSPIYGTQFVDDGCDSIIVTFQVSMNIRNGDFLYLLWSDYSIPTIFFTAIPSSNVWTITLQSEIEWLAFQFETFGSGGRAGRYVHIDWIEIDCKRTILDVGLLEFKCNDNGQSVNILAQFDETSDFELQNSQNGIDWNTIHTSYGERIEHIHESNTTDNYYRIKYDNKLSNTIYCNQTRNNANISKIKYYNVVGQLITNPSGLYIKSTEYTNGGVGIEYKIKIKN